MKRSIKLAVAAAVALSATSAFATNGDHLIGMGAKARGMGGIGIGMSHGAETALSNPALITTVQGTEVSFGGTIFMPDVENSMDGGNSYTKSDADLSVIPEVAIASKANDNFSWGIGMYGTAGMGVDYGNNPENFNFTTNLQLMQFAVPLAYQNSGFSIGVAPVLQYGSLDISYSGAMDPTGMFIQGMLQMNPGMTPAQAAAAVGGMTVAQKQGFLDMDPNNQITLNSDGNIDVGAGAGVAQDFGMGYNIGLAYSEEGLTVGASYKSAIDMEYKGQITGALASFQQLGILTNMNSDHLEQPAEIGAGISYTIQGHTLAFDYKQIQWASAEGYKDFKWEDQDVYILGYQYAQDNWAVRLGYNHASNPIKEQDGNTLDGAALNLFNLTGFPAIVEDHYSIGGSYAFNKMTSVDVAYVYVPEVTETYSTAAFAQLGNNPSEVSTKHSQDSVSLQLNFNF